MPKPHSEHTKQQARQLYEQRGARHAAETLDIAMRTVEQWARQHGWARHIAAVPSGPALGSAQRLGWAVRKRGLADEAGATAAGVLGLLNRQLERGKPYGVRDLAVAFSVLTERADAMTAHTGGLDQPDVPAEARVQRVIELVDVAEQREASGG